MSNPDIAKYLDIKAKVLLQSATTERERRVIELESLSRKVSALETKQNNVIMLPIRAAQ